VRYPLRGRKRSGRQAGGNMIRPLICTLREDVLLRRFGERPPPRFASAKGKRPVLFTIYRERGDRVGVCAHFAASDWITDAPRPRHDIAKGMAPNGLHAEFRQARRMMRQAAVEQMHLFTIDSIGLFGTTASSLPETISHAAARHERAPAGNDDIGLAILRRWRIQSCGFHEGGQVRRGDRGRRSS